MAVLSVLALSAIAIFAAWPPYASGRAAYAKPAPMIQVEGGVFQMGDVWGDGDYAMRERPVHEVRVDTFYLGRREVSVEEFAAFARSTGYRTVAEQDAGKHPRQAITREGETFFPNWRRHWFHQPPDHPVVAVAWEDAIAYCNWLSSREGLPPAFDLETGQLLDANGLPTEDVRQARGYRLPTEAEWEFAARERGGKRRFGNGQDIARPSEMNFDADGSGETTPRLKLRAPNLTPYNEPGPRRGVTTATGSFPPNALGFHDMSGNAWEWCVDRGGADYPSAPRSNPYNAKGSGHILRGGQYDTDAKACRVSARIDWHDRAWCAASGFRLARTP